MYAATIRAGKAICNEVHRMTGYVRQHQSHALRQIALSSTALQPTQPVQRRAQVVRRHQRHTLSPSPWLCAQRRQIDTWRTERGLGAGLEPQSDAVFNKGQVRVHGRTGVDRNCDSWLSYRSQQGRSEYRLVCSHGWSESTTSDLPLTLTLSLSLNVIAIVILLSHNAMPSTQQSGSRAILLTCSIVTPSRIGKIRTAQLFLTERCNRYHPPRQRALPLPIVQLPVPALHWTLVLSTVESQHIIVSTQFIRTVSF
eukprot:scpid17422/ scgid28313/ 